jgi:hypothetical protein
MENIWLYLAHNCPDHPDRGIRITEGSLTLVYKQSDFLMYPDFVFQQTDRFEIKSIFGPDI